MEAALRTLVRYLVAEGLIEHRSVVDGGMSVTTGRSRHRFAVVKNRSGQGYFVKQPMGELLGLETLAREAELYRMAATSDRMRPLRDLLPHFHRHDREKNMLVTRFVADADNLSYLHDRLGAFPVAIASQLGGALASLHSIAFDEGDRPPCFAQQRPWILLLHRGGDLEHLRRSKAASQVIDVLLGARGLADHLAALHDGWSGDRLIHTDMRWENCLLAPRAKPIEERRLYLIDWELADIGDPAWDVAGMLQAYLTCWIGSMPRTGVEEPERLAAQAKHPLETIQPAIQAFWNAYLTGGGAQGDAFAFLERSVRLMAARMLVTAFEISARADNVDARVPIIVQTSLNILDRSASAIGDLLGIRDAQPGRADGEMSPGQGK
jgi:aminoglycoside phosphotransferase (APT) family kinase protein